jgi:haloalkane dehalogenase
LQARQLGSGKHFLQEDHPKMIGQSIATFIAEIESRGRAEPTLPP